MCCRPTLQEKDRTAGKFNNQTAEEFLMSTFRLPYLGKVVTPKSPENLQQQGKQVEKLDYRPPKQTADDYRRYHYCE